MHRGYLFIAEARLCQNLLRAGKLISPRSECERQRREQAGNDALQSISAIPASRDAAIINTARKLEKIPEHPSSYSRLQTPDLRLPAGAAGECSRSSGGCLSRG